MNTLTTQLIENPFGENDNCIKFIIDDKAIPFNFDDIMTIGQQYTLSFYAKSLVASSIQIQASGSVVPIGTTWQKHEIPLVADVDMLVIYFNTLTEYFFYNVKLERGDKATNWEPSPLDLVELDDRVTKAESSIKQNSEGIETKVSKDGIISAINQTAEEVKINALRIALEGLVTANKNFKILEDGSMETTNGKFTGIVHATELYAAFLYAEQYFKVRQTLIGGDYSTLIVEGNKSSDDSEGYTTLGTDLGYFNFNKPVRQSIQTAYGNIDTYNTPFITEDYTDNAGWHIRKYSNGVVECEGMFLFSNISPTGTFGEFKTSYMDLTLPSGLFNAAPNKIYNISPLASFGMAVGNIIQNDSASKVRLYCMHTYSSATTYIATVRCWSASSGGVG